MERQRGLRWVKKALFELEAVPEIDEKKRCVEQAPRELFSLKTDVIDCPASRRDIGDGSACPAIGLCYSLRD